MIQKLRLPKWNDILVHIYKAPAKYSYCERLNRKVRASITYLRETVKRLAQHRLIKIVPMRKKKRLELTDKGRRIATRILEIRSELYRED